MALLELRFLNEEKNELKQLSQQLEKENVETLYNSLKQQVNPHFMFNSLSVLSSLMHHDIKKADIFIQHFSDIYRYVLDMNNQKLVPLSKELSFLEAYLFLQGIRFGENLHVEYEIIDQIKDKVLPPLSLQLVFENILKHNVISNKHPMYIKIYNKEHRLIIENNLKPKAAESSGIGIQNLKEKYRLLNVETPVFEKRAKIFHVTLPLLDNKI